MAPTTTGTGRAGITRHLALSGLGQRVHRTGCKTCVVQTRRPADPKRMTLGHVGEVAPEQARKHASEVMDRIRRGIDPMPEPPAQKAAAEAA